jgi:hypothetical protein
MRGHTGFRLRYFKSISSAFQLIVIEARLESSFRTTGGFAIATGLDVGTNRSIY